MRAHISSGSLILWLEKRPRAESMDGKNNWECENTWAWWIQKRWSKLGSGVCIIKCHRKKLFYEKYPPFPPIQSWVVLPVGPKPSTIKCHPCMCGVSVCLYAPTLDLGERGRAQIIYLGMSLHSANSGIKKVLQNNCHANVFSYSQLFFPPMDPKTESFFRSTDFEAPQGVGSHK